MIRRPDGKLYTGISKRPLERFRQHNTGRGAKFLRGYRDALVLEYCSLAVFTHSAALRIEKRIKLLDKDMKELYLRRLKLYRDMY